MVSIWGWSRREVAVMPARCGIPVWRQCGFETHRAGSRVGDLPSVGHPLVIGTLLVGEGSVEDHADVGHGVDTNCWAFKHRAVMRGRDRNVRETYYIKKTTWTVYLITCCAYPGCVTLHWPRDREDSIYHRVFCVLCRLYVNISCKRKEKITSAQTERLRETSRSAAQALLFTNIYTTFS